jgi:hypothetical protein
VGAVGVGDKATIVISSWDTLPASLRELEITGCAVVAAAEQPRQPVLLDRVELGDMNAVDMPVFPAGVLIGGVRLRRVGGLTSLRALDNITGVRSLAVERCPSLTDLATLARWSQSLEQVVLDGCGEVTAGVLANLGALRSLAFVSRTRERFAVDLSAFRRCRGPLVVTLTDYSQVDVSALAGAGAVEVVIVGNCEVVGHQALGDRLERWP